MISINFSEMSARFERHASCLSSRGALPFLTFVHLISEIPPVRRIPQEDAFATMTKYEIRTYEQWLGQPELIKKLPALISSRCMRISAGANGTSLEPRDKDISEPVAFELRTSSCIFYPRRYVAAIANPRTITLSGHNR